MSSEAAGAGGVGPSGSWLEDLGLCLDEASGTGVRGHLDLGPRHHTPWGVVHGGVYATIVESAASVGASLAVRPRGQIAVGVHNATDFLRSMTEGRVDVVATPIQQGRVQQLWDVAITRGGDATLVAQGRLRLQNVPRPEMGGSAARTGRMPA
jgi:1,4-dihydroxy-2-naphthoyl-CoA hydrolase